MPDRRPRVPVYLFCMWLVESRMSSFGHTLSVGLAQGQARCHACRIVHSGVLGWLQGC